MAVEKYSLLLEKSAFQWDADAKNEILLQCGHNQKYKLQECLCDGQAADTNAKIKSKTLYGFIRFLGAGIMVIGRVIDWRQQQRLV